MKRTVKVSTACLRELKKIRQQFRDGYSETNICPSWDLTKEFPYDCDTCAVLFPRTGTTGRCPCIMYEPSYLIKRLTEIINYNEKEEP
ncbi:MAG: hypothetical protein ACXQTR_05810 [Candidatus Methanospirareceae archaeon]